MKHNDNHACVKTRHASCFIPVSVSVSKQQVVDRFVNSGIWCCIMSSANMFSWIIIVFIVWISDSLIRIMQIYYPYLFRIRVFFWHQDILRWREFLESRRHRRYANHLQHKCSCSIVYIASHCRLHEWYMIIISMIPGFLEPIIHVFEVAGCISDEVLMHFNC